VRAVSIRRLLVANRGEIAVRIFRTCRELGIETIAVAAPDDVGALHVRAADQVVEIAGYLHSEEHTRAAKTSGADAIHPGYGFLAENADFAEAVDAAGLTWIGPPPEALRAGGDKLAAKRIAREAGVPVLPDGDPEEIGFPLLVKAAAGGGGRGMRVVRSPAELADARAAAEREAAGAFGDGSLYLERYLERPRHVEVQLLADTHGTVVALGERECSVQRRHQKLLEETPSPAFDDATRARFAEAACRIAERVGYVNAGTVEFLFDGKDFFLLEINTRIQVEHCVSEAVSSIDLVAEQLRIASGEPLSMSQAEVVLRGSAIETRVYAEDPLNKFMPCPGRITAARFPTGPWVREDRGFEAGGEITPYYDGMIAKLVVWGPTRDMAIARTLRALREYEVEGIRTNLKLLRWLVELPVAELKMARSLTTKRTRNSSTSVTAFAARTPMPATTSPCSTGSRASSSRLFITKNLIARPVRVPWARLR
jgi:acetyl/propionyl-CoA carboxylase alpha subunit